MSDFEETYAVSECSTISGKTLLMVAASKGDLELCQELFERKADPNVAGMYCGQTPLMLAIKYPEVVEFLLNHGAHVNTFDNYGHTALTHACVLGNLKTIVCLLEHKANPNHVTKAGSTPLKLAIIDCELNECKNVSLSLLKDGGCDLWERGCIITNDDMKFSAQLIVYRIVVTLIEHGANVNHASSNQHTALSYAVITEKPVNLIMLLVKSGGDLDHKIYSGNTIRTLLTHQAEKHPMLQMVL